MGIDVGELDLVCLNFLSQPVVLDVEMLRPLGQTRVSRYLDARLRVVMQCHAVVFLKDFEVTAQSLEVQCFLGRFECCDVFSLCSTGCYRALLLRLPRDSATTGRETPAGCGLAVVIIGAVVVSEACVYITF